MPDTIQSYVPMLVSAASLGYGRDTQLLSAPLALSRQLEHTDEQGSQAGSTDVLPLVHSPGCGCPDHATYGNPKPYKHPRRGEGGPRLTLPLI